MAAMETAQVLRQCGVNAASSGGGDKLFPSELIISAYEQIEGVIEDCFPTLSDLMISLHGDGKTLTVRLMLVTETLNLPLQEDVQSGRSFSRAMSVTRDGNDALLLLTYTAGGESA